MEAFGDIVVLKLHGRMKIDKTPRIVTDEGLRPLDAGFCAANLGKELRRAKTLFAAIKANTQNVFNVSLEQAALILFDGGVPNEEAKLFLDVLRKDLLQASTTFETWFLKWLGCLEDLPFNVFELGGDDGQEFALAFLLAFQDALPDLSTLEKVQKGFDESHASSLTRTFHEQLTAARQKHAGVLTSLINNSCMFSEGKCECNNRNHRFCDTLGLLSCAQDAKFLGQLQLFVLQPGATVQQFPRVYEYVKLRIYASLSDQQRGESIFSVSDQFTQRNMTTELLSATVQLHVNPSSKENDELRTAITRAIRLRPKDYGTMTYIKRHVCDDGKEQGKRTRRKACKASCTCGNCHSCAKCAKNFCVRASLKKHLRTCAGVGQSASSDSASSSVHVAVSVTPDEPVTTPAEDTDSSNEAEKSVYCLCKSDLQTEVMLECDGCKEWYHLVCLLKEWGVMIFEHEAPLLTSFYCEKDGCRRKHKFSQEELTEWGGNVVDHRIDLDDEAPLLYKIQWDDGSPAVWVAESEIPDECLEEYRDIAKRNERKRKAPPETKRRPLPKNKKTRRSRSRSQQKASNTPCETICTTQPRSVSPARRSERPRTPKSVFSPDT